MGLAGCTTAGTNKSDADFHFKSATRIGQLIPSSQRRDAELIEGNLLGGNTYRLADDKGKVVVINFWSTWCGPCKIETPQLDALYRQQDTSTVDFVGIDTKDLVHGAVESFVSDNKISYPIVVDEPGKLGIQLGNIPTSMPYTVLIDKTQRVAAVYLGQISPADLRPALTTLQSE